MNHLSFPKEGEKEVIGVAKPKEYQTFSFRERTYWSPFVLQNLSGDKFIRVVNKILKGEYVLLKFNSSHPKASEETPLEHKTGEFFNL